MQAVDVVLTKEIKIRYSETDKNLMLKPSCLMNFLEDMASESAEQLGFGYTFVKNNNLAWFLLKYRMEFINYPEKLMELTIKTEPRGYNKLFAYRNFELIQNKKTIAKISSMWSLVDINSRSMVPVNQLLSGNSYMKQFEKREDDLNFEKIKPINNIENEKLYEIRYDDIDVNGHANNSNYIIWALEPLGYDFRANHKIKTVDMVFKKEVKFGDKIVSQFEISENKTTHLLKSHETGEDLCMVDIEWV